MRYLLLLVFGLMLSTVWAQFPPLEISADDVITTSPGSVEVPIRAGTNWQNIVNIGGSITFDTTVITYDQISFWGLSNPSGATFTYVGGGVLTYQWFSLISVGPTLSAGQIVFTIKFNAVGNVGDISPVAFANQPQNQYWNNGFGWSGGYASTNGSVEIACPSPNGGYTSAITGSTACFTDTTSAGVTWEWDFGDGNTSTLQNPCHTYANPGNYTACMIVSDTCTSDTICTNVYICGSPSANWSSSSVGLVGQFTDASTNIPTSWLWDFGDGATSTSQNPNHLYSTEGTYTVCLIITNPCGADTTCNTVTISCPSPTAAWTESSQGLTATFNNQSIGAVGYSWDFGDGFTSTLQNPTHLYATAGTYTVCLISTSQCGNDTTCSTVTIVCDIPVTDWSSATQDLTVSFADMSSQNPTSWSWDFGDGNTSTMQSPSHTYATAGSYTVCLTTTNNCGSNTTCYTIDIICDLPVASWSQSGQGANVTFINQTTQGATSWFWDFGDGNSSTMQNPTYTYAGLGTYYVCLFSMNACGTDSSCANVVIADASIFENAINEVKAYPNPATDFVTLVLPNEQAKIDVFDVNQKCVGSYVSTGNININTTDFSEGVYFIRIDFGTRMVVGRFVKR